MDKFNNDIILEMMALSEEVNTLNFKLTQWIRTLNMNPELLGNAKDLSRTIMKKAGEFGGKLDSYEPPKREEAQMSKPSYTENGNGRDRVFPGPGNNETKKETIAPVDKDSNRVDKKPVGPRSKRIKNPPTKDKVAKRANNRRRKPLSNV